jgi:hypothetical protein
MRHALARVVCLLWLASVASPRAQGTRVNPDAKSLADLSGRIKAYKQLHQKIETTLPKLSNEATAEQLDAYQRQLGNLIKGARSGAKHGDVFTSDSRAVIRRLLAGVFAGPDGHKLLASINDDNPGPLTIQVNGRYPDAAPLTTMPEQVLQNLPVLPDELEYRFIGRRLILLDAHAHLIVDYVDDALPRR